MNSCHLLRRIKLSSGIFCSVVEEVPVPGLVPSSVSFFPPSPSSFVLIRHKSSQREIKTKRCLIIHVFFQICLYLGQCFPGWDVAEMDVLLG